MSGIQQLPPEIVLLVLQGLNSPGDVFAAIASSRQFHYAYLVSPSSVLRPILQNLIHPSAMHHALAIVHAPTGDPPSTKALNVFIKRYFEDTSPFPTATGLVSLCRIHKRVSRFIEDYATKAQRALSLADGKTETVSLSESELARFQRAFLRYDVYCLAFPVTYRAPSWEVPSPEAQRQWDKFLSHLEVWELEEMTCIHSSYMSLVDCVMEGVENDLVYAVLHAPGVTRKPKGIGGPIDEYVADMMRSGRFPARKIPYRDMEDFCAHEFTCRGHFSAYARHNSKDMRNFFASLGSAYLYQLVVVAGRRERRDAVQSFALPQRTFLPEVDYEARLEEEAQLGAANTTMLQVSPDEPSHNTDPSRPGPGYVDVRQPDIAAPGMIMHMDRRIRYDGLREQAYVFWDADRISRPHVTRALGQALLNSHEYVANMASNRRDSVQKRLEGFMIPRSQMNKIKRKFGHKATLAS